jgi:cob(I)alamin adenosyltransferase
MTRIMALKIPCFMVKWIGNATIGHKLLWQENRMKKGLLMVLTGDAEDKTVSAFGQVFRALGQGLKVCVIEFSGNSWLSRSPLPERFKELLTVHTLKTCSSTRIGRPKPDPNAVEEAWQLAKETMNSGLFEMVVLSEFVHLLALRALDIHEVVDFLSKRRAGLHVIITGTDPPQLLIDAADLVTAINNVTPKR